MPRTLIPTRFSLRPPTASSASLSLSNPDGHVFSVHPVSPSIIRVAHELPKRYKQKTKGGIDWETPCTNVLISVRPWAPRTCAHQRR